MKKLIISLVLAGVALLSCNRIPEPGAGLSADEVAFKVKGSSSYLNMDTKATVVNTASIVSSGFKASMTKGEEGEETLLWGNVAFTHSAGVFSGGKWWPSSDQNFHFYASNVPMTHSADGNTVAADNATDVVVAYLGSPAYRQVNSLVFNHVFAFLGDVTVAAEEGYTLSGVSIRIVPQTGGTYDIKSGAWSDVTTGSSTEIADVAGVNTNDFCLVPGTYRVLASWTATKGDYSETFTDMDVDVTLVAGRVNKLSTVLGGRATELRFSVSVTPWDTDDEPQELAFGFPTPVLDIIDPVSGEPISSNIVIGDVTTPQSLGTLVSHVDYGNGIVKDAEYNILYSVDGGETWSPSKPEMISSLTVNGETKSGEENEVVVTLSERPVVSLISSTFGSTQGSPSNYVDLSLIHPITRMSMARETANCYIVNAPGYYKIPLFYGNSVVDGQDYSLAAGSWLSNSYAENITRSTGSGNIAADLAAGSHTLNTSGARKVWCTGNENLVIVDSNLEGPDANGVYYLKFHVPAANIQEGNAVVGVLKDGSSNEFIWSWHIWIVSNEMALGTDTYTNAESLNIGILNWPLGATRIPLNGKIARSCLIKLTNDYAQQVFEVSQESIEMTGSPFCLVYQWGRSAPFLDDGYFEGDMGVFYGGDWAFSRYNDTLSSVSMAISKPYLATKKNILSTSIMGRANYWDANMTESSFDEPVNKTFYDPSPAGFSVPRLFFGSGFFSAFSGFDVQGNLDSIGDYIDYGWFLKRNVLDTEGIFWREGIYWTSGFISGSFSMNACEMRIYKSLNNNYIEVSENYRGSLFFVQPSVWPQN